ncbi:hypothetical protein B0H67DRAFT_532653, partial [Lasiosphaeris hirsuta]
IFICVFIITSAYGFDSLLRHDYQNYATTPISQHSLISTINVLRSVVTTPAQLTTTKPAEIFSRVQLIYLSYLYLVATFFCLLDTIITKA